MHGNFGVYITSYSGSSYKSLLKHQYELVQTVVKVRGNARERHSSALKIAGELSHGPHTAVNATSRLRGGLQPAVGPQIFLEFLGPRIYTLTTVHTPLGYAPARNYSSDKFCRGDVNGP